MKQNVLVAFLLPLLCGMIVFSAIMDHRIMKQNKTSTDQLTEVDKTAFDKRRNEYMFNMMKDPATGRIPDGIIDRSFQQALMSPERNTLSPNDNSGHLKQLQNEL